MIEGKVKIINNKRNKNKIDINNSSINILQSLFHGSIELVNEFKLKYFQKHPVVYRNNDITSLKSMLFDFNIRDMLNNTASDNIHVWLNNKESDSQLIDSISIDNVDHAYKLYKLGNSLYCRASNEFEEIVISRILNELNIGISSSNNDRYRRGEIETFFSRKGHRTTYHTDFQENFTIQLVGKKKWYFKNSLLVHPLRGFTPHYESNDNNDVIETQLKIAQLIDSNFVNKTLDNKIDSKIDSKSNDETVYEVILNPGDVLYHPAGVWHEVECIDEESLSINISLMSTNYVDILSNCISQLLLQNPLYRQSIKIDRTNYETNVYSYNIIDSMIKQLPSILNQICPLDVLAMPTFVDNSSYGKLDVKINDEVDSEIDSEGDSEEDKAVNENIIDIKDIEIISYFSKYMTIQSSYLSNQSNSLSLYDLTFHINPLAICLSDNAINQYINYNIKSGNKLDRKSDNEINRYVIHIGFGNDTYESMYRSILLVDKEFQSYMTAFLVHYDDFHNNRIVNNNQIVSSTDKKTNNITLSILTFDSFINKNEQTGNSSKSNKRMKINNHNKDQSIQFLFALHLTGLITLN